MIQNRMLHESFYHDTRAVSSVNAVLNVSRGPVEGNGKSVINS